MVEAPSTSLARPSCVAVRLTIATTAAHAERRVAKKPEITCCPLREPACGVAARGPVSVKKPREPLLVVLTRARARLDVVVAAGEGRHPIRRDVARAGQEVRPRVADDRARRLPDDLELAVALDLAAEDGLRDVMVRHHRR